MTITSAAPISFLNTSNPDFAFENTLSAASQNMRFAFFRQNRSNEQPPAYAPTDPYPNASRNASAASLPQDLPFRNTETSSIASVNTPLMDNEHVLPSYDRSQTDTQRAIDDRKEAMHIGLAIAASVALIAGAGSLGTLVLLDDEEK